MESIRREATESLKPQIRTYHDTDQESVLALWRRTGVDRPWLDLRAEIAEKRKRDRSLFLVAEAGSIVVGAVMGAYDGRRGVTKINLQVRHDNLDVCAFYERLGYMDEHLVSFGKRLST